MFGLHPALLNNLLLKPKHYSVVHCRYVLTAAHCVRSKLGRPAVVLLGEHDLKTECDCEEDQSGCNPETQRVCELTPFSDCFQTRSKF